MSENHFLIITLLASVATIILLIVKFKLHATLALLAACFVVGFGAGMSPIAITTSIEKSTGDTLGFLAIIVALGSVLGAMLEMSGGAEQIATTLLGRFGRDRAPWVMTLIGFIAGIPVLFEVGFILLIPLVYVVARETRINMLYLGVPLAISLMAVHCMLPPHPAAIAITRTLNADVGTVILYGLIVGLPTTIIAGPLWIRLFGYSTMPRQQAAFLDATVRPSAASGPLPGFGITLFTILLPLLLMVLKTLLSALLPDTTISRCFLVLGNPLVALLIAVAFSYWSLGLRRGASMEDLLVRTQRAFLPLANIMLIIGLGGAFNGMLIESGIGKALATEMAKANLNPIVLAWLIAGLIHFAVGSATVSMISAAGMISPLLASDPTLRPEIMVIAIGAGAIGWAHVTDSAFWVVKEYLGVSLAESLKKFTGGTVVASITALLFTLALSHFVK